MSVTPGIHLTANQALDKLERLYQESVTALRAAIQMFIEDGTLPDREARARGLFAYPQLRVHWDCVAHAQAKTRAYGRFTCPGSYVTTITRPQLFRPYLAEQLAMLEGEYAATI